MLRGNEMMHLLPGFPTEWTTCGGVLLSTKLQQCNAFSLLFASKNNGLWTGCRNKAYQTNQHFSSNKPAIHFPFLDIQNHIYIIIYQHTFWIAKAQSLSINTAMANHSPLSSRKHKSTRADTHTHNTFQSKEDKRKEKNMPVQCTEIVLFNKQNKIMGTAFGNYSPKNKQTKPRKWAQITFMIF